MFVPPPADRRVLSRHRLPAPYRLLLALLWGAPAGIVLGALLLARGWSPALLDLRLLLPLALLVIPVRYVWREGIDVLPAGIFARVHLPRYYPYAVLRSWALRHHPEGAVLTVWDTESSLVLAVHAAHLSDLPGLLRALRAHVNCHEEQH